MNIINKLNEIYHSKYFPRIFYIKPDGGKDSGVTGYFLIEWKVLFSVAILHFNKGGREAYHNHAFNAVSFFIKGNATESKYNEQRVNNFKFSLKPKYTPRDNFHRYEAHTDTYCLTFRGPWLDYWYEIKQNKKIIMTHGRKILNTDNVRDL